MLRLSAAIASALLGACLSAGLAQAPGTPVRLPGVRPAKATFLNASGARMYLGKLPFRNIGVNMPDLLHQFLTGDEAGAQKALADAALAGARFARCIGCPQTVAEVGDSQANSARWVDAFERMAAAANSAGLGIVPVLAGSPAAYAQFAAGSGAPDAGVAGACSPGTRANALILGYVSRLVDLHRADTRILLWEVGDELNRLAEVPAPPEAGTHPPTPEQVHNYLAQVAVAIRSVDKNHLVSSGNGQLSPWAWHQRQPAEAPAGPPPQDTFPQYEEMLGYYNPQPIGVISVHISPVRPGDAVPRWIDPDPLHSYALPWSAYAANANGRPLFLGRFSEPAVVKGIEQKASWTAETVRRLVEQEPAPLAAIGDWEPANSASADTVSPTLTPTIVRGLADANATIRQAILDEAIGLGLIRAPKQPAVPKKPRLPVPPLTPPAGPGAVSPPVKPPVGAAAPPTPPPSRTGGGT